MSKKKAFALAVVGLMGLAVACSNQGEGDRCNSDDDCAGTLACVARATFTDTSTRVCCPLGANSSNEFCKAGDTNLTNPDAAGPEQPDASDEPDAGDEPDGALTDVDADAGGEVETDSGSTDAGSDADGS